MKIFCIAEVVILFTALGLAVIRSLPGPVFFPLRLLAIVYSDIFRGIPTILLIYLLGFGIPALGLAYISEPELLWGVPAEMVWGTFALILVYTAYVSEVYRAGIESVHSSQNAAARSLGLSLRAVAAVRRRAPGGAPRHSAASQRLHRPPEGHCTSSPLWTRGGRSAQSGSTPPPTSTSRDSWSRR